MTIQKLINLKETEDKVEFKEAKHNFSFAGSEHREQEERRKCFLGYVVALANEKGGILVMGMGDKHPHTVVGTDFASGTIGNLEDETYTRLQIRIHIEELFDDNKLRVLVIHVPSRPLGKMLKFEGVPLMRTGGSLRNMSDDMMREIILEHEPDFSATLCAGLTMNDMDENALQRLKESYARKQQNQQFLTLSAQQVLSDLGLIQGSSFTYAALILVGKKKALRQYLPQANIRIEYRGKGTQINFDQRYIFEESYLASIDTIWDTVNLRNGNIPIQEKAGIYDIPFFNEEVIREAMNNAVAHRDYRLAGEIVIKQYPQNLEVISPGGFPNGVSVNNLLTVPSTPRNRLLSDTLAKAGFVERSGQGIDKIFYQTLSESKPEPDYSKSDSYWVCLSLSAIVEDKAFVLFLRSVQAERADDEKLSVEDIITLNQVRKGSSYKTLILSSLEKLRKDGLVEKVGKTNAQSYILSKSYYEFTGNESEYTRSHQIPDSQAISMILHHLNTFPEAGMRHFVHILQDFLSRQQIRRIIGKLVEDGFLAKKGEGVNTLYSIGERLHEDAGVVARIVEAGIEVLHQKGELPDRWKKKSKPGS